MKKKLMIYHLIDNKLIGPEKHILYGTIEDIRTYAKNLWVTLSMAADVKQHGFDIEEDYYLWLDNDRNLLRYLAAKLNVVAIQIYEVDIEDFSRINLAIPNKILSLHHEQL